MTICAASFFEPLLLHTEGEGTLRLCEKDTHSQGREPSPLPFICPCPCHVQTFEPERQASPLYSCSLSSSSFTSIIIIIVTVFQMFPTPRIAGGNRQAPKERKEKERKNADRHIYQLQPQSRSSPKRHRQAGAIRRDKYLPIYPRTPRPRLTVITCSSVSSSFKSRGEESGTYTFQIEQAPAILSPTCEWLWVNGQYLSFCHWNSLFSSPLDWRRNGQQFFFSFLFFKVSERERGRLEMENEIGKGLVLNFQWYFFPSFSFATSIRMTLNESMWFRSMRASHEERRNLNR